MKKKDALMKREPEEIEPNEKKDWKIKIQELFAKEEERERAELQKMQEDPERKDFREFRENLIDFVSSGLTRSFDAGLHDLDIIRRAVNIMRNHSINPGVADGIFSSLFYFLRNENINFKNEHNETLERAKEKAKLMKEPLTKEEAEVWGKYCQIHAAFDQLERDGFEYCRQYIQKEIENYYLTKEKREPTYADRMLQINRILKQAEKDNDHFLYRGAEKAKAEVESGIDEMATHARNEQLIGESRGEGQKNNKGDISARLSVLACLILLVKDVKLSEKRKYLRTPLINFMHLLTGRNKDNIADYVDNPTGGLQNETIIKHLRTIKSHLTAIGLNKSFEEASKHFPLINISSDDLK